MTTSIASYSEEGKITDHAIELMNRRVGVATPQLEPGFEYASVDVLRNYARGLGDLNPLYNNVEYASESRWGGLVGHPTFMLYMGVSEEKELSAEQLAKAGRGDPLASVHSFYAGTEINWYAPICPGDRLAVRSGLAEVKVKESRMGGRSVHQSRDSVYWNQQDVLVGLRRQLQIRVDRAESRSHRRYLDLGVPHRYTEAEILDIEKYYENEYIRGAEPRYWEDTAVGESSVPLLKGPYTTTAYICFAEGTGHRNEFHRAHADAYQYRRAHPKAFPLNEWGFPDTIARVHWDKDMALRAGLPETYDFGGERIAAMSQTVTNWMGDDAFLRRLKVSIRQFFFVGDTIWLTCTVADKFVNDEGHGVRLELSAKNQRDDIIATGEADVLLPSRQHGEVNLPIRPAGRVSIFQPG